MEQWKAHLPIPSSTESFSEEALIQSVNARQGKEMREGYNCPICHNKEYIVSLENGIRAFHPCQYTTIRQNLLRLRIRGLLELYKRNTFDRFDVSQIWQKQAKAKAMQFVSSDLEHWFTITGASGYGKTHLCTAIAGSLITKGYDVQVVRWVEFAAKAKSVIGDSTAYAGLVQPLKDCEVLYIDDFLKVQHGQTPTAADIRLAFEILDARYCSPKKAVILSSEFAWEKINALDVALAGRIYERSEAFLLQIQSVGGRNYRLK